MHFAAEETYEARNAARKTSQPYLIFLSGASTMKTIISASVLVFSLGMGSGVQGASILAYSSLPAQAPNQSYGGSFGMDFTPSAPAGKVIEVTQLGLYSGLLGGGTGTGFAGDDFATLFNSSGTVLAQLEFGNGTGNGTLVPGTSDYVKTLSTPVFLAAGTTYTIAAFYTSGTDHLANVGTGYTAPGETGSPFISYVGAGRYGGAGASSYPGTVDSGPANRYNGPTFAFQVVPEPSSFVLSGLGAVAMLLAIRRRGRA